MNGNKKGSRTSSRYTNLLIAYPDFLKYGLLIPSGDMAIQTKIFSSYFVIYLFLTLSGVFSLLFE